MMIAGRLKVVFFKIINAVPLRQRISMKQYIPTQ